MCGAFTLHWPINVVMDHFTVGFSGSFAPNYNVRPSEEVPVILGTKPDTLTLAEWGLHVEWGGKRHRLINSKKESLNNPYADYSFRHRRCLIPADGFYEWIEKDGKKQPVYIRLRTRKVFAFAGIFQEEKDDRDFLLPHFSIITTEPNAIVAKVHHRMPAILLPADERRWLDPKLSPGAAIRLIQPYPPNLMKAYPASKPMSQPQNDAPAVKKSAQIQRPQNAKLF